MKNVISSLCRGRFVNEQDNSRVIVHRNLQKLGLDTWDTAVVRLGYQTDQGRA